MKSNRSDILVLVAGIVIIAILSSLLYYTFRIRSGTGYRSIGSVTYRYRIAQRKSPRSVIWENTEQHSPVHDQDWIRTDRESEATIHLEDGSKIRLDPESMIVLTALSEDETRLELKSGSIILERGEDTSSFLRIANEKDSFLFDNGNARISDSAKGLIIESRYGNVFYNVDGENFRLDAGKGAVFSDNIAEIFSPVILLTSPADGQHFYLTDKTAEIELTWHDTLQSTRHKIELSKDSRFDTIYRTISGKNGMAKIRLPEGEYYWRALSPNADPSKEKFETRRISVRPAEKAELLFPLDKDLLRYVVEAPMIRFSWKPAKGATSHLLMIWKDSVETEPVIEKGVQSDRVAISLEEGKYFWRLEPNGPIPESFHQSEIRSFTIVKAAEIPPPDIGYPSRGETIGLSGENSEGVLLTWTLNQELHKSEIIISRDILFSEILIRKETENTYFRTDLNRVPTTYYWKIRGYDRTGKFTDFSRVGSFIISVDDAQIAKKEETPQLKIEEAEPEKIEIKPEKSPERKEVTIEKIPKEPEIPAVLQSPRLILPARDAIVDMTKSDRIEFEWSGVRGAESYEFNLLRENRVVFNTTVTGANKYTLTDLSVLDVGEFTWTVRALSDAGPEPSDTVSAKFKITLKDTPAAPGEIQTN